VLAHTYNGLGFADVRLNGHSVTEAELNALMAAEQGVPVGLVTGDTVICAVAENVLPGVVTVPVKTAIGYTAARSKHPSVAREAIRAGAERAVANAVAGAVPVAPVPGELVIEVELRPHGAAELAARVPGTERLGARTVRRRVASAREMLDVLVVWYSLTGQFIASQA
jgi:D-amino peptidase